MPRNILYKNLLLSVLFAVSGLVNAQKHGQEKWYLTFEDNFTTQLDTAVWKEEIAPLPGSNVYIKEGKLVMDTKGGVTVWLTKKLTGNVRIEYVRTVLVDSGRNDRLSDLNSFWMATDPRNKNLFTRDGVLEHYDSLRMYYVGMGGNSNSTTRFRKYSGEGERTLLREYKDEAHLLQANKTYHITIEVIGNKVCYFVDGKPFFEYNDPQILKEGYFGFRSTKSRQSIDWIKVYTSK